MKRKKNHHVGLLIDLNLALNEKGYKMSRDVRRVSSKSVKKLDNYTVSESPITKRAQPWRAVAT